MVRVAAKNYSLLIEVEIESSEYENTYVSPTP